jgi:hypothetical protein
MKKTPKTTVTNISIGAANRNVRLTMPLTNPYTLVPAKPSMFVATDKETARLIEDGGVLLAQESSTEKPSIRNEARCATRRKAPLTASGKSDSGKRRSVKNRQKYSADVDMLAILYRFTLPPLSLKER